MLRNPASLIAVVVFLAPQAAARAQTTPPPPPSWDVAFVADGAGNYQMASKSLRTVALETNAPFMVETFVWSHGLKKVLPDQTDFAHIRQQGQLLAEQVLAYRKIHPEAKVHLVGHSAGCMVVLTATEFLPPETLDRVVLLLPSVSIDYDIRPALRSVKGTVEVHYSGHDWLYLGLCMRLVGTADRKRADAGGRVGFPVRIETPQDELLVPRLVQHPWQPLYRQLGNDGGHYGAYQPEYLKVCVLPVLIGPAH